VISFSCFTFSCLAIFRFPARQEAVNVEKAIEFKSASETVDNSLARVFGRGVNRAVKLPAAPDKY